MESTNQKSFFPIRKNSLGIDLDGLIWNDIQLACWYGSKFGPTFDQMMCEYLNPFKGKSEYEELADYYKSLEDSREEDYENYLYQQYLEQDEDNDPEPEYESEPDNHSDSDSESEDDGYWIEY